MLFTYDFEYNSRWVGHGICSCTKMAAVLLECVSTTHAQAFVHGKQKLTKVSANIFADALDVVCVET